MFYVRLIGTPLLFLNAEENRLGSKRNRIGCLNS
jgi:hypothetical protein